MIAPIALYSPHRWRPVRYGIESLSRREMQVVQMIALTSSSKEIADQLGISVKSVLTYRRRAMEKLNLPNTQVLIHFALDRSLVKNLYASEPNG